ncbi:Mth938-like domain-containing protein [Uliginosibacterium gangwonense]|uniref:Mth938-like domain-containing protein n=1 Tax=Uliginosibacterium gangwonense TaxID=392736 RepID=UPI000372DB3A|nr:Mth938-like domain-containing protein [Uliginosibacterium gangwonense]
MKLQRELPENLNLVNAYDAAAITVNRVAHPCNLVVAPQALRENWLEGGFDALSAEHLAALLDLKPALVLLGTGARQYFPKPAVLRPLVEAGVGWEVMDTGSACRTYNILASEGREVVAALLLPTNT